MKCHSCEHNTARVEPDAGIVQMCAKAHWDGADDVDPLDVPLGEPWADCPDYSPQLSAEKDGD